MSDYRIDGPAVVSFSGGRTSAYMLRKILDAGLQSNVHVIFENTGKERPETLDFVRECSARWGVEVRWIERVSAAAGYVERATRRKLEGSDETEPPPLIRDVTFETAIRKGEPFDQLLVERKAYCAAVGEPFYLPGWGARYCSVGLKTDVMRAAMFALGHTEWTNVVGIRYDEPRRWTKYVGKKEKEWEFSLPLFDARVTKRNHVKPFWAAQPFDLQLDEWEGNCDLCPLKKIPSKVRIMRDRPDLAQWWLEHEKSAGVTFRLDHAPLAVLQTLDARQAQMFEDEDASCVCDLEAA